MRRILGFLILFVSLFALKYSVFADQIECEYEDLGLTMTWDTEKDFNVQSNPFVSMAGFSSSDDYERFLLWRNGKKVNLTENAYIDQKLYKEVLDNYGCNDNMYVCIYTEVTSDTLASLPTDALDALFSWDFDKIDLGGYKEQLVIMTGPEYRKSDYAFYEGGKWGAFGHDLVERRWDDGYNFGDVIMSGLTYLEGSVGAGSANTFYYKETDCEIAHYDGPYIGVNINCSLLKNKLLEYIKTIAEYEKCASNDAVCIANSRGNLNNIEDQIKNQCRSLLQNLDYKDGEAECIDTCMSIKEILNEYKEGTDLYEEYLYKGSCGFTDRLLVWINNILRWLKYMLPIGVIVLSIVDFIKAIVSDKDDEMKKSQGRFIRRLIAAALAFIIPLIITFILDKMGFGVNSCGLF